MKVIKASLLAFVAVCIVAALSMLSHAAPPDMKGFRTGEIVVEIKPGSSIEAINKRNRTITIERMYGTNFYRLRIPRGKSENKWIKRLAGDEGVLSASLNPIVMSPSSVFGRVTVGFPDGHATPGGNRSDYISQPDLFNLLSLSDAQLRSRGEGVVVAIIDTGI